jgi:hypothetical protein
MKWLIVGFGSIFIGLQGFGPKTLVGIRSQAVNAARELAGWQRLIFRPNLTNTNTTIAITPEYTHSFSPKHMIEALFGCNELAFSGSQVIDRNPTDILADYFGLPSDFQSFVQFDPVIVNFVMDFDWYIGLDGWASGLYVRVHAPIVHSKWDLQMVECIADPGTTFTSYPAGYLAATPLELTALTVGPIAPTDVTTVFQGNAKFGDMNEPLKFGKIFGRQSVTQIAELWFAVGYNFLLSDWYHAGFAIRTAAPTGTLRNSEFLFEPIAGNDHHWELGAGFTGHVDFWTEEEKNQKMSLFFDANITHMFVSRQRRSFDLTPNGCGSRYMLLQQIYPPAVGLHIDVAPNDVVAPNQYQGFLVPAINKTTLKADISVPVQADMVLKFGYQRGGFEFDVGYNLWIRSKEKCHGRECLEDCWAVKGDAQIYGFTNPGEIPVGVAATQSNATIMGGQAVTSNMFMGLNPGNFNEGFEFANINADNIAVASDNVGVALWQLTSADANRLNVTQIPIRTSNPPILLTDCNIDECSALLPRALSHKIFFYIGNYFDRPDLNVIPYLGGGGFIEWAHSEPCSNSAQSQWGLWLKFGLTYGK